jgi:23S rRNA (cytosine1962-C5)-methyltransferase
MMTDGDYELLDFGSGRKLERFGDVVLDRPCPAAEHAKRSHPKLWQTATARYDRTTTDAGKWSPKNAISKTWPITFTVATNEDRSRDPTGHTAPPIELTFALQPSPFGHVGVFPEQFANWQWLARHLPRITAQLGRPPRVLNLFAYTGGSTLAAAAAGAEVVHIDAAANIVDRARHNAELSMLAERPIRWIAEDAVKFCRREVKRGNRYDAVILDPPSYGHGPKGEAWKIENDLPVLLDLCGELTERRPALVLATCHSPNIGPAELAAYLSDGMFGHCGAPPATGELSIETHDGRKLASGAVARWPG